MCLNRLRKWFWPDSQGHNGNGVAPPAAEPPMVIELPPLGGEPPCEAEPIEVVPEVPDEVILPSEPYLEVPPVPPHPGDAPIPPFPAQEPVPAPYLDDEDYLDDELERIDLLLKAYLLRRKSARLLREAAVADDFTSSCASVLGGRFRWADPVVDEDCRCEIDRLTDRLKAKDLAIQDRLRLTMDRTRSALRLVKMIRSYGLVPNWADSIAPRLASDPPVVRKTFLLDVLLLALLADRSPRYRAALAACSPDGLTTDLILDVVQPDASPCQRRAEEFAADGLLPANYLILLGDAPSPGVRHVQIDERIADYLLGKDGLDPKLGSTCRLITEKRPWDGLFLDEKCAALLKPLSEWWWPVRKTVRLVMLFHGPAGSPFLPAAQAFLTWNKLVGTILVVDVPAALARPGDWIPFVGRCYREAGLRRAAVFWQGAEVLLDAAQHAGKWETVVRQAEQYVGPTILASNTAWDPARLFHAPNHYFVRIEFSPPTTEMRQEIWKQLLQRERNPLVADKRKDHLATLEVLGSFQFTEGHIDDALATARGLALAAHPDHPAPDADQLIEGCRRQSARRLVSFAQRIQPRTDLADLKRVVLPPDAAKQLEELAERMQHLHAVHHRLGFEQRLSLGRGLVALFTGPSGSGKTMAATILAGVNKKDLYKVDMAAVTSKYIGETEKNLNRVFADAQDANAVLFFDEADAMFGKRGEVEQAQDRWANLEVNFLLQRIEEYTGTVILATNFRQNIDTAFLRRVQMLIHFPLPKPEHRLSIFEGMFPDPKKTKASVAVTPPSREQLKLLADRFELSGGSIKNVVLDAAFRCVAKTKGLAEVIEEPIEVDQRLLVLGVAREYQKLGKPITVAEFGREFFDLVSDELKLGRSS